MTKLAIGSRSLALCATTLGVGGRALRLSRRLAGARSRLTSKALFRFDTELAGFAEAVDADPWMQEPDQPIPERVLNYARDFLRVLPSTLPEPMVTRGEDGGLVFEWSGENARVLRVRIGTDGMLVYTGRLGARRRISGAEPLGEELPVLIRQAILQVAA
jgi:hypothetical protein